MEDDKKDVTISGDITVGKDFVAHAGNDVTIHGVISGMAEGAINAVDIRAQERFLNVQKDAKDSAYAIKVGANSNWKVYSHTPYADDFGGGVNSKGLNNSLQDLNSGNYAVWEWDGSSAIDGVGNFYIFKDPRPTMIIKAKDATKSISEDWRGRNTGYDFVSNTLSGQFMNAFLDGDDEALQNRDGYKKVGTDSDGYAPGVYSEDGYPIKLTNLEDAAPKWFKLVDQTGLLKIVKPEDPNPDPVNPDPVNPDPVNPNTVNPTPANLKPASVTPVTPPATDTTAETQSSQMVNLGEKPQLDALINSLLEGSASISQAQNSQGPGTERVLGLQSAELPFFNEKHGTVNLYGTYDVSVDPDKVKMEPTAKVLPEPDQPKTQYREYEKEIVTEEGSAKFRLTYNGSTLDIYPTDATSKALLMAGDADKNVEIESKAMYEAFTHMGITLDDLDGVYTHFDKAK